MIKTLFFLLSLYLHVHCKQEDPSKDIYFPKQVCRNTESGKYFLADSEGFVCERKGIDLERGCCTSGERFSCETCEDDGCCSQYENCVACCLSPQNNPTEKYQAVYRIREIEESGKFENEFEYCKGICRTWRHSTVHENAFIGSRRFCFSEYGRPLVDSKEHQDLGDGITMVRGDAGKSCSRVCDDVRRVCDPQALSDIRSCDNLRKFFICEAGCGPKKGDSRLEPYYISNKTAKKNLPAYCVLNQGPTTEFLDCEWSNQDFKRLCACRLQ